MGKPCPDVSILTRDFLSQAYCIERRSVRSIAREVHCRNGTIIEALKRYGLSHHWISRAWFIEHYIDQQESVDVIAAQLGCTEENVRAYLRNFDIPIRYKSRGSVRVPILNDRSWLYDQYVVQQKPSTAIADEIGCCVSSVQNALARFAIPRRKTGPVQPGRGYTTRRAFSHRKRRLILQRDGHQCRWCGSLNDLEIHHIVPAHLHGSNDLHNGITLCSPCHRLTFGKEADLTAYFQSIIAQEPLT